MGGSSHDGGKSHFNLQEEDIDYTKIFHLCQGCLDNAT